MHVILSRSINSAQILLLIQDSLGFFPPSKILEVYSFKSILEPSAPTHMSICILESHKMNELTLGEFEKEAVSMISQSAHSCSSWTKDRASVWHFY